MDDRRHGASRGTELGLQAASLAPLPIPCVNQALQRLRQVSRFRLAYALRADCWCSVSR